MSRPSSSRPNLLLSLGLAVALPAFAQAPAPPAPTVQPGVEAAPPSGQEDGALEPPGEAEEEGDIVEIIDDPSSGEVGPSHPGASVSPVSSVSGPQETFSMKGWARSNTVVGMRRERSLMDPGATLDAARHKLVSNQQVHLRFRYARGTSFEAVTSGLLAYELAERGPAGGKEFNGFNGDGTASVFEAGLREAYLGFFFPSVDLRAGRQRLAWGRADAFQVNDILNARDQRDPLLAESEVFHIPTLMARADVDVGLGTLQLVVTPFRTQDRFDLYGSNWALIQNDAPDYMRGVMNLIARDLPESERGGLQSPLTDSPSADFADASAGTRFSWTANGFDVSHYYHYGYDRTPNIQMNTLMQQRLQQIDYTQVGSDALFPVLLQVSNGDELAVLKERNHHFGSDLQTTFSSFALRVDAAFDSRLVFLQRTLLGRTHGSFKGAASLEYQTGEAGKTILVEALYQRLLGFEDGEELLGYERDNVSAALLARWTFFDELELECRGLFAIQPRSVSVRPQVSWKRWQGLTLSVGAILLGGEQGSLAHYYRKNSSVYGTVRYAF